MPVWRWPILIGVLTVFGLLSALLGQFGLWVWLAWIALSIPLFVIFLSINGTSASKLTREMVAHLEHLDEQDWASASYYEQIRALPRFIVLMAGFIFSRACRQTPLLKRAMSGGSDVYGKLSLSARTVSVSTVMSMRTWFRSTTHEWRKAVLLALLDGTLVWVLIHVAMPQIIELAIYALVAVGVILAFKNATVAAIHYARENHPDV